MPVSICYSLYGVVEVGKGTIRTIRQTDIVIEGLIKLIDIIQNEASEGIWYVSVHILKYVQNAYVSIR